VLIIIILSVIPDSCFNAFEHRQKRAQGKLAFANKPAYRGGQLDILAEVTADLL
jgi:hypothetical protein